MTEPQKIEDISFNMDEDIIKDESKALIPECLPPEKEKVETYVDKKGITREKKTGRIVKGSVGLNQKGLPMYSRLEKHIQKKVGKDGANIIQFLLDVMTYDQKKRRHVKAWYTSNHKIEAAKLLLQYGFGKPRTHSVIDKNVRSMKVNINVSKAGELDLNPEDM